MALGADLADRLERQTAFERLIQRWNPQGKPTGDRSIILCVDQCIRLSGVQTGLERFRAGLRASAGAAWPSSLAICSRSAKSRSRRHGRLHHDGHSAGFRSCYVRIDSRGWRKSQAGNYDFIPDATYPQAGIALAANSLQRLYSKSAEETRAGRCNDEGQVTAPVSDGGKFRELSSRARKRYIETTGVSMARIDQTDDWRDRHRTDDQRI